MFIIWFFISAKLLIAGDLCLGSHTINNINIIKFQKLLLEKHHTNIIV